MYIIWSYIQMYVCMHVCMHVCMYVCIYYLFGINITYLAEEWEGESVESRVTEDIDIAPASTKLEQQAEHVEVTRLHRQPQRATTQPNQLSVPQTPLPLALIR